ncbi:MAG: hypothetical protein FWB80_00185 [Defluviitaleaceae bacterium]|nr:hypothetical protein [Defluviitaleaceae bacterium]
MNASNFLENAVLNHFFRNTPSPAPAQVFLALYTSNPMDDNTGMEVAGGAYARQRITFSAPVQSNEKAEVLNSTEIRFPVATAGWGSISHFGIFTAATGGNFLAHGAVPIPREIVSGDEAVFRAGALAVRVG